MDTHYIQGSTDNTCALVALVNAMYFYGMKIPHKNKLKYIINKYKISFGASSQDLYCLANELGLHLSAVGSYEETYIDFLKKNVPIIVSCNFKKIGNYEYDNYANYKQLDFKLKLESIRSFIKNEEQNLFFKEYSANHTVFISQFNEKNKYFLMSNFGGKACWSTFDNMYFIKDHKSNRWNTSYIVTKDPIKITGLP